MVRFGNEKAPDVSRASSINNKNKLAELHTNSAKIA